MNQMSEPPIYLVINNITQNIEITAIETRINHLPKNMRDFEGTWSHVSKTQTLNDENYEDFLKCGPYRPFHRYLIADRNHCSSECYEKLQNLTVQDLKCNKFQSIIIIEEEGVRNQQSKPIDFLFQNSTIDIPIVSIREAFKKIFSVAKLTLESLMSVCPSNNMFI